jgi:hypothetical protein
MAEKPKRDPVEDAHFRIDEHERKFAGLQDMASKIPGMVEGGVGVMRASLKSEFMEALAKDVETDTRVIERLDKLIETNEKLAVELRAVAMALGRECTRESVINLPSGPVTMTVRERKN